MPLCHQRPHIKIELYILKMYGTDIMHKISSLNLRFLFTLDVCALHICFVSADMCLRT
jgi:hypothetical protein